MLKNNKFWKFCNNTLHYKNSRLSLLFDGFITILIIISISITPLFLFDQFSSIKPTLKTVEYILTLFFLIEYLLRLWSSEKRLLYIISVSGIIDLLAVGPLLLQYYNIIHLSFIVVIAIRVIRMIKLFFIYKNERDLTIKQIKNIQHHGDFEKGDNEIMLGIVHKHALIFFVSLFPIFIFTIASVFILAIFSLQLFSILTAGALLLIAILIFAKNWIDFHYDAIYITDKRVVVQDAHLLGSDQQTIPLVAIKEIHPKTYGILNLLLDSGSIDIDSGATENAITFNNVSSMKKMKKILLKAHINQIQTSS